MVVTQQLEKEKKKSVWLNDRKFTVWSAFAVFVNRVMITPLYMSSLLWGFHFLGGKEYPQDKPFLLLQTGAHHHGKAIIQPTGSQCFYTATITISYSLVGCKSCFLSLSRPVNSQLMQQCPSTWGNCSRIPKHTSSVPFPHLINSLNHYSPPKHSTNHIEKHLQNTLLKREG